jgi:hypothetical protein
MDLFRQMCFNPKEVVLRASNQVIPNVIWNPNPWKGILNQVQDDHFRAFLGY